MQHSNIKTSKKQRSLCYIIPVYLSLTQHNPKCFQQCSNSKQVHNFIQDNAHFIFLRDTNLRGNTSLRVRKEMIKVLSLIVYITEIKSSFQVKGHDLKYDQTLTKTAVWHICPALCPWWWVSVVTPRAQRHHNGSLMAHSSDVLSEIPQ